jgi:hypothetical protein
MSRHTCVLLTLAFVSVAFGCAAPGAGTRRVPTRSLASSRATAYPRHPFKPAGKRPARGSALSRPEHPAATLVATTLAERGLRFGTDGSVAALWGYLSSSHKVLPAAEARAGDVLFFETTARPAGTCSAPDHAGIVIETRPDGRLGFVEARAGRVRQSYADPLQPSMRRDPSGQVRNTFLRPKHPGDPPGLPIFAGEMLCAAARIES